MGLSFPTFPLVVGPGFGVQTQLGQRQLEERLPQQPTVAASALGIDPAPPGLSHGGGKAAVGSIGIVAPEPAEVPRVPQDRQGKGGSHPRNGSQPLHLWISSA